ncbi:DEAD/DEAH box helicase [Cytobacillus firmus]|uniref:DEAD/DEAH box helicase n=1 Tax=Cytobacillus firmus TaxID=1399 RepID=UPI003002CB55
MTIFQKVKANIDRNAALFNVQLQAYNAALAHYTEFKDWNHRETLIVMPTGSGKTGVMSILPFGISNGKVLIITPGKIVRKTVYSHFDSVQNPEKTFWIKRNIIFDRKSLPKSYLYQGYNPKNDGAKEITIKKLREADIVITNVHKLGSSNEEVNLMRLVDQDFFDMIIIDEAHHVAATMWQDALDYFKASKIIKLTATPFRSDKQAISTHEYDPIFEYTLGEAITDGLVKNIVKQEAIPGELSFTDRNTGKKYNLQDAKIELGNDFVSKSIAMSESCSKQVIEKTKTILSNKRKSYPKHQVLAVTCNDDHAQDVCRWFNELDLTATYVSVKTLSDKEIEQRLNDFANGIYDVMVSIQMLGEGYDNPNISIISLFRPFKTLGPYAQAVGRGLRKIMAPDVTPLDNFCNVVYHQELGLEKLWEYYKEQETYGQILLKQKKDLVEQLSFEFDELGFVEKKPNPYSAKKDGESEEDLSSLNASFLLDVSAFSPHNLGKNDSFTQDGIENYNQALDAVLQTEQDKLEQYRLKLQEMVDKGFLSIKEAETLLEKHEIETQNKVNTSYDTFNDLIVAESLRKDFINWVNTKLEEFFKMSSLAKEDIDLVRDYSLVDNEKINNIGFISRNIRQSLYEESKKNISLYNDADFARAKDRVIEKLSFWLKQYPKKEE